VKRNLQRFEPQKPNTIARSLAIGNPADGPYAIKLIGSPAAGRRCFRSANRGRHQAARRNRRHLSRKPQAAVTAGVTQKLIGQNRIKPEETTVVCVTGNGLKTTDAISAEFPATEAIRPAPRRVRGFTSTRNSAPRAAVRKRRKSFIQRRIGNACDHRNPDSVPFALTGGAPKVDCSAATVAEALNELTARFPDLSRHVRDDQGKFANSSTSISTKKTFASSAAKSCCLKEGDRVLLVPSIAGGSE